MHILECICKVHFAYAFSSNLLPPDAYYIVMRNNVKLELFLERTSILKGVNNKLDELHRFNQGNRLQYTVDTLDRIKEGVLLRNVSAAPICDHFTVVAPGCWIREPVPFLT